MKPQQIILDEQEKPEMGVIKPIKTQKMVASIKPHKGHSLFEINPVTGKCKLAEFESVDAKFNGGVRKKVIANDNCVYISALNKKNALIKFFKMVGRQMEKNKK